jgi:hypothetical protein
VVTERPNQAQVEFLGQDLAEALTIIVCDRLVNNVYHVICATIVGSWQEAIWGISGKH